MTQPSMTALVSAFARAYHNKTSPGTIYEDPLAAALFSPEEYQRIENTMTEGVRFFSSREFPSSQDALRHIITRQLAPSPLGRAAFAQEILTLETHLGARQYLLFGAGYDTFPYRQPPWANTLSIFELDQPATAQDKQALLKRAGIRPPENVFYVKADLANRDWCAALHRHPTFHPGMRTVCSLLGLSYSLTKEAFSSLLSALSTLLSPGSSLVFDYPEPAPHSPEGRTRRQSTLAAQAGAPMQAVYSLPQLEALLAENDILLYEHLTPPEITARFFAAYNASTPQFPITALEHVCYCHAVKNTSEKSIPIIKKSPDLQ